ncbi:MAG: elongation factor P [Puniceicoccales bacterium]|jgi:elongation factor P|nr:elongation factor P [Puniceicoccales bacterium]
MANPTDIRKGKVIAYNGVPHAVLEVQHRTQGRQAGFVQVTMRNLLTGASTAIKFLSSDSITFLQTSTVALEYSYVDDMGHHFLNTETYEDVCLPNDLIEGKKKFLAIGKMYDISYVDDKPVEIILPASILMKVVESPDGIRGDTASNVQKPATTETGLIVQVPLFIKPGEVIRVSSSDGSYIGRA